MVAKPRTFQLNINIAETKISALITEPSRTKKKPQHANKKDKDRRAKKSGKHQQRPRVKDNENSRYMA